ncbi:hypothetical protein EDB84DRAFT_1562723 [Lactarius hengduanensis]|nr:hypothetical protein EDB84DRAFT_1562723 [Lactarius hengduanensis]
MTRSSDDAPHRSAPEIAIDGLIVLDSTTARPIVQTSFRSFPPRIHFTSTPTAAPSQGRRSDRMLSSSASLSHFLVSRFWSRTFDPLYAFTFVRTFLNILIEYFGEVTAPVLRDNFDIVHKLLEETIDAGGHSLTTALNALRDIVLPSLPHPASPPLLRTTSSLNRSCRNGTITTSSVLGKVDVNCKLSGAPFLASIPLQALHLTREQEHLTYFSR